MRPSIAAWTSPSSVTIEAIASAISWSAPGRNTRAKSWGLVTSSWSTAIWICGVSAVSSERSALLRTGM